MTDWRGEAPDIGAYESGSEYYWIPGFQFEHASTPVPPDGTQTAKRDCSLMWLAGYRADVHHLYAGKSKREVESANPGDHAHRATFEGQANVYDFPQTLSSGETIYWRVDAVRNGRIARGKVWKFSTE